ncbi:unnamed protein product [Debaryomyces fabryi]|nr:unnamed protein product [Debaryomyces fabryi]
MLISRKGETGNLVPLEENAGAFLSYQVYTKWFTQYQHSDNSTTNHSIGSFNLFKYNEATMKLLIGRFNFGSTYFS